MHTIFPEPEKRLLKNVFCEKCGREIYTVSLPAGLFKALPKDQKSHVPVRGKDGEIAHHESCGGELYLLVDELEPDVPFGGCLP